jgi:hypothetical protein
LFYRALHIKEAYAVAIDEISMISQKTLFCIDSICRHVRQTDLPMGGLQTILVGDFKVGT